MAIKGKILYNIKVDTLEIIKAADFSAKGSQYTDTYIPSTEAYPIPLYYPSPETEEIEYAETGGSDDGYLNGNTYLAEITTTSTAAITGLSNVEFAYFRHTGYRYNKFTDSTVDTNHSAGSGSTFGSNPKILQMDSTTLVPVGATVSGTGIAAGSVVTQIDSATLFRVDIDTTATNNNQTITFSDHLNPSTTANTTDHLEIRGDADDGFVVAVLPPGAGIALPVQSPSSGWGVGDVVNSANYFFQSVDPDDLTAGAQTIAMEFICVTAA